MPFFQKWGHFSEQLDSMVPKSVKQKRELSLGFMLAFSSYFSVTADTPFLGTGILTRFPFDTPCTNTLLIQNYPIS